MPIATHSQNSGALTGAALPATMSELRTWEAQVVVSLVSRRIQDGWMDQVFNKEQKVAWHRYPLQSMVNTSIEDIPTEDWKNLESAISVATRSVLEGKRTVVHCAFGNHRTGFVIYCVLRIGMRYDQERTLEIMREMRPEMHFEMTRSKRKQSFRSLIPKAEAIVQKLVNACSHRISFL